ncbi:phospholipase B1, membrane-associated-like [Fopius arisanus]|uniref:Phospholipase B1, membrane-associated-like n=1 Tax=Fopius arisanus TaxID=64838 RepID=A0A9R1T1X6_9HYME|nr:PREDICTED: phospholipase B1, membrane-associated-like [Fopius arisanus]
MDPLKLFALTLMMYSSGLHGEDNFLDTPGSIQLLRNMKELIANIIGKTSEPDNPVYKEAQKLGHIQPQMSNDTPFPCDVSDGRSQRVPTSIHKLKAGDIDIIGAMGDSLTAGFGIFATNIFNIVVENRGASAYGGGQRNWRELLTLPNILKEYNSNLYGYATDDSFSHQSSSHFNVGESLAMSRDLPYMANNLIQRMKSDPRVDIENHWKVNNYYENH